METPKNNGKPPKDKRTKAYKEWVKAQKENQSTGLGDVVEKVTKATGIKKVVDTVFDAMGKDCGCSDRKKKLNKIRLPWSVVGCFTEEQYKWWTNFKKENPAKISHEQWLMINNITKTLFGRFYKKKPSCCFEQYINRIDKVYEKYQ